MVRRPASLPIVGLALSLVMGCSLVAPTHPRTTARKPPATVAVNDTGTAVAVRYAPLAEAPRAIDQVGQPSLLTGKVKLLSDHGGGLISNNTGNLLSDNGGGIIANNGGGIIANNGGGLTGKVKRQLLAAAAPPESLLADAQIEVLDAEGHYLAGKDGKPIAATSDHTGNYQLKAVLPDQNLLLRVRLYNGGQLFALLPRAKDASTRQVDLDTASSLGARYVLDKFVDHHQTVLDKLPAPDVATLHDALDAARVLLPATPPSYQPADLLAAATDLEAKAQPVHAELERIKAILLAGQANLGDGRPATDVALAAPSGVVGDAAGNLYISELSSGRIRRVDPAGKITVFAGGAHSKGDAFQTPQNLLVRKDGTLLLADSLPNVVRQIALDGTVSTFAGTGHTSPPDVELPAKGAALDRPTAIAEAPDGSVYIGEVPKDGAVARILRIDPAGVLHLLPPPADHWSKPGIVSLVVAPDGSLYALDAGDKCLHRRKPDGTWYQLEQDVDYDAASRLAMGPDGALYIGQGRDGIIRRFAPDDTASVIAGTAGQAGYSPDGTAAASARLNSPTALWFGPDGTLFFVEVGNGLVRAIDMGKPDHPIRTVAGTRSPTQTGLATTLSISSPGGLTLDPDGKLVVAEATGNTIKRLDGQDLTVIAGAGGGKADDSPAGVPALQAKFATPAGVAYDGKVLWVLDAFNERLRRIDENGIVTSVAGAIDGEDHRLARLMNARMVRLPRPVAIAVGPDHMPYFIDNQKNLVWRLRPDGQLEIVVGLNVGADGSADTNGGYSGDGGPAYKATLRVPTSLAFDSKGDLYISDSGNMVIRKVTGLSSPEPTISTVAGIQTFAAAATLLSGVPKDDGGPASQAILVGPGPLAFDANGNLYVGELGTDKLATLGAIANIDVGPLPHVGARIRRIAPDGTIMTIAGDGTAILNDPDNDDILIEPLGLLIDRQGRLIIADGGTNQIKLLPLGKP